MPSLPVAVTVPRPAIVVALVIATLGLFTMLWIGGEMHYENCVTAAQAEVRSASGSAGAARGGELENRIEGCSRLPF